MKERWPGVGEDMHAVDDRCHRIQTESRAVLPAGAGLADFTRSCTKWLLDDGAHEMIFTQPVQVEASSPSVQCAAGRILA